ncbi:MAG: acyltransferase [Pseudomonadota bacterium]
MNEPARPPPILTALDRDSSFMGRVKNAWRMEFANLRIRLLLFTLLAQLLPVGRATLLRTTLIRAIGFRIGAGTRFLGAPKIQSQQPGRLGPRVTIGRQCVIGARVILESGDSMTLGDRVSLADGVVILTTTHQLGPREHRAGTVMRSPVVIGNDVQVGADVIILPGATLGDGARVLPNSVVNAAVAAGITVSGIPARPLRQS